MKTPTMRSLDQFSGTKMYAVFIRRRDGTEFISHGPTGPALFHQRELARKHKSELETHKFKCLLRPIFVTIATS